MPGINLYANMCTTELWNRERTAQYVAAGIAPPGLRISGAGCPGLMELVPCIQDQPPIPEGYVLPELDPAPWYDPAIPESKDFAGLHVLEAELSPALDRRLVQNIGHGGIITRARFAARTLTVRGALIGRTGCAVEYGLRWLTQALLGSFCGNCDGCDLTFLTCCPCQSTDACLVVIEDGRPVPYFRGTEESEWERGTDFVRQMYGAGVIAAPEVRAYHGKTGGCGCSTITEVEFTLGIGNPWLYRLETTLADEVPVGEIAEGECEDCSVVFVKCVDGGSVCPEVDDCGDDPDCTPMQKPPAGSVPTTECGCIPLMDKRTCVAVPADREWFEQVLIIELNAGSEPMRNVQIQAFQNPLQYDCCDPASANYFDDCSACATLLVNYIPAHGVLTFDSAARRVTLTCNGVTRNATKNLTTIEGLPFRWFELGCQDACVIFDVDCGNVASDATASIQAVGREL